MKKFVIFLLCLLLIGGNFPVPARAADQQGTNLGCYGPDAQRPFLGNDTLIKNGKSAILYEMNSDTLMYALNADERMYPASLVKIMTALIAIEQGNLDSQVEATKAVLDTVDIAAVSADLQDGEIMTLKDLLYCMLVGSANDAASVIAHYVGGSQAAFVSMMNSYAAELGCKDTNFTNAHGLHDKNQYTTARDMVRILKKAMDNSLFAEMFGTIKYTVPATNKSGERELLTGNYLMNNSEQIYYDSRVTGGRTGIAQDKTRCVAATAESGNMKLAAIVFGADSRYAADGYTVEVYGGFQEVRKLLDTGFEGYQVAQVLYENQVLGQRKVANGDNDLILGTLASGSAVLPADFILADVQYRFYDTNAAYSAPISKGTVLSKVEVWYYDFCIAEAELIALNSVEIAASKLAPETEKEEKRSNLLWVIVLVLVAVPAVGIFVVRGVNMTRRKRLLAARRARSGRRR